MQWSRAYKWMNGRASPRRNSVGSIDRLTSLPDKPSGGNMKKLLAALLAFFVTACPALAADVPS
jgi:hypothetical protein